jgi:hypothetical protein
MIQPPIVAAAAYLRALGRVCTAPGTLEATQRPPEAPHGWVSIVVGGQSYLAIAVGDPA